jgi:hypothetical protein
MSRDRALNWSAFSLALLLSTLASVPTVWGDVIINEVVKEERSIATGGAVTDTREFIELYNPTASPINIGDWQVVTNGNIIDTIPTGKTLASHDYYVFARNTGAPGANVNPGFSAGVVDQYIESTTDLYPDVSGISFELKDNGGALVDALTVESNRGTATTFPGQTGPGWWGQQTSTNAASWLSLSRWRDGRDTNNNGRDFGHLRASPGLSNNVTEVARVNIPNVDAAAVNSILPDFGFSFVGARVINPQAADANNPKVIPFSPQGQRAIVAWDQTGGGNAIYSKELVRGFDLWAYIDPEKIGVAPTSNDVEWESWTYGLGTTNELFNSTDTGGANPDVGISSSGNTGLGWHYEKFEEPTGVNDYATLKLIDFNDGGDSDPLAADWNVVATIDLEAVGFTAGWHRLSIDYDPATGAAVGKYDEQTFNFNAGTDVLGTFYAGYREAITGAVSANLAKHHPPIFDMVAVAPAEDADFDNDSDVDGNDFLIWQRGLGVGTTNATGDANASGTVNAADLAIWKTKFGIPATAAVGAVPEPGTLGLALLAVGAALAGGKPRRFRSIT